MICNLRYIIIKLNKFIHRLILGKKNILVTGAAGFIGYHVSLKLIAEGFYVFGFDNLNDYYEVNLKQDRLKQIQKFSAEYKNSWQFIEGDLQNKKLLEETFNKLKPSIVINLAAQAGVRYSIKNPIAYINSNIVGFGNLLECCRSFKIENLIYASSSSVYGGNTKTPFKENDSTNHPVSLYAATKRSNELMAHTYSHLYNIPSIGLRFFTVYGPWGRPDMAPMIFAKAILTRKPIRVFNKGYMSRSFTYINDVIEIIYKLISKPATADCNFDRNNPDPSTSWNRHRIFNLGNENSIKLLEFIQLLENELGIKSIKNYEDMQPGDVQHTSSDSSSLMDWIGECKYTSANIGVKQFINWYKDYYKY